MPLQPLKQLDEGHLKTVNLLNQKSTVAYRKFTLAQKRQIIQAAAAHCILPKARKLEVSQSLNYKLQDKAAEGKLRETGQSFAPNPHKQHRYVDPFTWS